MLPSDGIVDDVTRKARLLLESGVEKTMFVRAFTLLQDAPWAVSVSEQAHGSGAALAKKHSYSSETLVPRTALHRLRSLFTKTKGGASY